MRLTKLNSNKIKKIILFDQVDSPYSFILNNVFCIGIEPPSPPTNTISSSMDNFNEDIHTTIDEPQKTDLIIQPTDDQCVSQTEVPANTNLVITITSPESTNNEIHSPPCIHSPEKAQIQSPDLTPTITPQQREESEQVETSFLL
jgi:hypothetical protein